MSSASVGRVGRRIQSFVASPTKLDAARVGWVPKTVLVNVLVVNCQPKGPPVRTGQRMFEPTASPPMNAVSLL
jgi:hypothetical protein